MLLRRHRKGKALLLLQQQLEERKGGGPGGPGRSFWDHGSGGSTAGSEQCDIWIGNGSSGPYMIARDRGGGRWGAATPGLLYGGGWGGALQRQQLVSWLVGLSL